MDKKSNIGIDIRAYEGMKERAEFLESESKGWKEHSEMWESECMDAREALDKAEALIKRIAKHTNDSRYEIACKEYLLEKERTDANRTKTAPL